jgi:hypothetical protein
VLGRCVGVIVAWLVGTLAILAVHVRRQRAAAAASVAGDIEGGARAGQHEAERGFFGAEARATVCFTARAMGIGLVVLMILFAVMLLLFFGVSWQTRDYYGNVRLAVLDLDGGAVGAAVLSAATSGAIPFSVEVLPRGALLGDVRARVDAGEWNAALVARPGASAALAAAAANPTAPYAAANATVYIFDQGRGGSAMAALIRNTLQGVIARVSSGVGAGLLAQLAGKGVPLLRVNPSVVATAVSYIEDNLHPVAFSGEFMATELGTEYRVMVHVTAYAHGSPHSVDYFAGFLSTSLSNFSLEGFMSAAHTPYAHTHTTHPKAFVHAYKMRMHCSRHCHRVRNT